MQKLIIGLSTTSLKYLRTMDNTPYNAGWLALGRASLSRSSLAWPTCFGDHEITTDCFEQFLVLTARVFYDEAES